MRFLISFCFSFVFAGVVFAMAPMLQQPLDLPIALSASFGELRPNHFHAGLDFKTEQQCGYAIRSVADGYVSRIKISQFGYGNCLYVTHPQGITTVYAHLDAFNDSITSWVRTYQYEHQTFGRQSRHQKSRSRRKDQEWHRTARSGKRTAPAG